MLRCTGRAYTPTAVRARPRRPGGAHLALPGPGVSRFVLLRRRRASRSTPGQGFNVDFIWIFAEVGGTIPADPTLPIPSNAHWMPLASHRPGAVPGGLRRRRLGVGGAVRPDRRDRRAADLGDRPRRRRAASVAVGAGVLVAIPLLSAVYLVQPDNFSLYQPLVVGALWMGARGLRGSAAVVRRSPACSPASPRCRATTACSSWPRSASPSRGTAGGRGARRGPASRRSRSGAAVGVRRGSSCSSWRRGGSRQLAVFGSLSPSTASGKVLFIRDIGEWNSITTPATLEHLLGHGHRPADRQPRRRAGRGRR